MLKNYARGLRENENKLIDCQTLAVHPSVSVFSVFRICLGNTHCFIHPSSLLLSKLFSLHRTQFTVCEIQTLWANQIGPIPFSCTHKCTTLKSYQDSIWTKQRVNDRKCGGAKMTRFAHFRYKQRTSDFLLAHCTLFNKQAVGNECFDEINKIDIGNCVESWIRDIVDQNFIWHQRCPTG